MSRSDAAADPAWWAGAVHELQISDFTLTFNVVCTLHDFHIPGVRVYIHIRK
jgi:hypothetical protein